MTQNSPYQYFVFVLSYIIQTVNMATSTARTVCILCEKVKVAYLCLGCSEHFCFDHLSQHRTNIQQQFEHLQNNHDHLREQINAFEIDTKKHPLIQKIDQWEKDSIDKIKQQAERCRTQVIRHPNSFLRQMEKKLNDVAQQLKDIHQENAFNEIDLDDLKQKVEDLEKELNQPTLVSIKQQPTSFINKISVILPMDKGKNPTDFIFHLFH